MRGYLVAVVRPRAELHEATLFVEREPLDVHLAAGLVDGRWVPVDLAAEMHRRFREQRHFVVAIGTARISIYAVVIITSPMNQR